VIQLDAEFVHATLRRELFEVGACRRREHGLRPARADRSIVREVLQRDGAYDSEIVISGEADVGTFGDGGTARVRSRPVADEIAEAPQGVDSLVLESPEDGFERM